MTEACRVPIRRGWPSGKTPDTRRPLRVLSIDGGGMRGLYSATYLSSLVKRYTKTRNLEGIDIGRGFDLITGTSTGAIIACVLAAGVPLDRVAANSIGSTGQPFSP